MRLRALIHRLTLSAAAAGLALTGLATPAHAAPELDFAYVGILSPETVTVINGQTKTVKFDLFNLSEVPAENVTLVFGSAARPIPTDLGFTAPNECAENICQIGSLKPGQRRSVRFTLKPTAAGTTAPASAINLATTVSGRASDETSITVVRTDKGGVDLELDDIADMKLSPGRSADVPVVVRNSGNQDVKAFGLVVVAQGVTPLLDYRNCEKDGESGVAAIVCVFNETLAGGGAFTLPAETPLRVKVPAGAGGPFDYPVIVSAIGLSDKFVFDFAKRTAGAGGKELKLESVASIAAAEPEVVEDLNEDDNYTLFAVNVPKTSADSAAIGGVISGAIGSETSVKVGVRNNGPTSTIPAGLNWIQYVHVKLPTGVELTKADERCMPGKSLTEIDEEVQDPADVTDLVCLVIEGVPAGERFLFTISTEILDAIEHKAGAVTVDGGVQDGKSGNDKAALTVKLTAGGGGGGLPITGAPAGLITAGGVALLVVGLIAVRTARRRRIVTVVE